MPNPFKALLPQQPIQSDKVQSGISLQLGWSSPHRSLMHTSAQKKCSGSLSGWRHLGAVKRTFSTSMLIPGVNKVSVQYIKHCHTDKDKHYTWSLPKGREGMRSAWDFSFCSETGPRLRSLQIHLHSAFAWKSCKLLPRAQKPQKATALQVISKRRKSKACIHI